MKKVKFDEAQDKDLLKDKGIEDKDDNSIDQVQPWDRAKVQPKVEKLPTATKFHVNIWLRRMFGLLFLLTNSFFEILSAVSFAVVVYHLHPLFQNSESEEMSLQLYSQKANLVFWSLLIPDFFTIIYSSYFIVYRRRTWPRWKLLLTIGLPDVLNHVFMITFVYCVSPFISKTSNALISGNAFLFPIFALTLQKLSGFRSQSLRHKIWSIIALGFPACVLAFYSIIVPLGVDVRPGSNLGAVSTFLIIYLLALTFGNIPVVEKLPFLGKYITREVFANEDNVATGANYHVIISHFPIAVLKILLSFTIYSSVVVSSGGTLVTSIENLDSGFTSFIILWPVCSALSAYLGKTCVRLKLQTFGFTVPKLVGSIGAVLICFLLDISYFNKYTSRDETAALICDVQYINDTKLENTTSWLREQWAYHDCNPLDSVYAAYIFPIITLIGSILLIRTRVPFAWVNKSLPYDFERNLFLSPSYRPVHTSVYNFFNRRHAAKSWNSGNPKIKIDSRKTAIWKTGQSKPMIFVCTTLWHETFEEMYQLATSLVRLIRDHAAKKDTVDSYDMEIHVFFDNVFEIVEEKIVLNEFVNCFIKSITKALRLFQMEDFLKKGSVIVTPYGGRIEYDILGIQMVIHLKDATKVKAGKRWSQVMYLYYLIGWKIDACRAEKNNAPLVKDKSFILTLDGDVDFHPSSVELCLNRLLRNDDVAACCGRIVPVGSSWLIWYQRFEYAVGHWLMKSAEHVLGCVLCSPGCFSLYRMSFLAKPNVMAKYKSYAESPMEKLQFDQGEDRWLCTLILLAGGRIEYESAASCNTFAPEDLETFYKQRRRWGPSTTANIWNLIQQSYEIRRSNQYVSLLYIIYQLLILIFSIIALSTTLTLVAEGLNLGAFQNLSRLPCYLIVIIPVALFAVICFISNNSELQLSLAFWFSMGYAFIMAAVLIGMIITGIQCPLNPSFLFFLILIALKVLAGILHFDFKSLICGVVYFLFIPSCFIFLQLYSIANLDDVSWGTRQAKKAPKADENDENEEDEGCFGKCLGRGCFRYCTCVICLPPNHQVKPTRSAADDKKKSKKKTTVIEDQILPSEELFKNIQDGPRKTVIAAASGDEDGDSGTEAIVVTGYNEELITPERLFGGFKIKKLRRVEEEFIYMYLSNPRTKKYQPIPDEWTPLEFEHVLEREQFLNRDSKYFSWFLDDTINLSSSCKVYSLSNPEYQFWQEMADPDSGHIGIRTKGRFEKRVKEQEILLSEDLTAFKRKMYLLYIFANLLWMTVSVLVIKYSEDLLSIDIIIEDLPGLEGKCTKDSDLRGFFSHSNFNSTGNNNESEPVVLSLQPFTLFFLVFYIVLTTTQFITMLWNRLSALYHTISQIDVQKEREKIARVEADRAQILANSNFDDDDDDHRDSNMTTMTEQSMYDDGMDPFASFNVQKIEDEMDDLPKIGFGNGSFLANEDSDSGIQKDRIMFLGAKKELSSSYRPTVMKDNQDEDEPISSFGAYRPTKVEPKELPPIQTNGSFNNYRATRIIKSNKSSSDAEENPASTVKFSSSKKFNNYRATMMVKPKMDSSSEDNDDSGDKVVKFEETKEKKKKTGLSRKYRPTVMVPAKRASSDEDPEINKTRKIKFSAEDEKRTYRPSEGLDEANQPIEFNISPPSADNSTSEDEDRQKTPISRAYRPTMVMKSNKVEYVETAPMAKVAFQDPEEMEEAERATPSKLKKTKKKKKKARPSSAV